MGRDIISHENIDNLMALIDTFEESNILVAKDERNSQNYYNKKLKKISALKDMLWFNHPTGYIFEKKNFNNIWKKKELFIKADIYPENYIIKELLVAGNGMKIHSGCNQGKLAIDKAVVKSQVEGKKLLEEMYYAPKRRTYQCYQILEMVISDKRLDLTYTEKKSFVKEKLESLLLNVSYGWKYCCTDPEWCSHYNQTIRVVTKKEMCKNVFDTYENICFLSKNNREIYDLAKKYKYYTLLIGIRIYFSRINHYCERIKYYIINYGFFETIKVLLKKIKTKCSFFEQKILSRRLNK